ncbi:MAG: hypothetical protein WDW38_001090 [Sanguina aurantia]
MTLMESDAGERPISSLLGNLVSAAHSAHPDRRLAHPRTHHYTQFATARAEAAASSQRLQRSSGGSSCDSLTRGGCNSLARAVAMLQATRSASNRSLISSFQAAADPESDPSVTQVRRASHTPTASGSFTPSGRQRPSSSSQLHHLASNCAHPALRTSPLGCTTPPATCSTQEEASLDTLRHSYTNRSLGDGSRPVSAISACASHAAANGLPMGSPSMLHHIHRHGGSSSQVEGGGVHMSHHRLSHTQRPGSNSRASSASCISFLTGEADMPVSADVEVVCQYDARFQKGGVSGQLGRMLRPPTSGPVGPLAYLFSTVSPQQQHSLCLHPTTRTHHQLEAHRPCPRKDMLLPADPQALPKGGRHLSRELDPVMNCDELLEMLEEFEYVPHKARRSDVVLVFRAAKKAFSQRPASATAKPLSCSQARPEEIRFPGFCDALMRLAVATACTPQSTSTTTLSPGSPHSPSTQPSQPVRRPASAHGGAAQQPSVPPPVDIHRAVSAMMASLGLDDANILALRQRLDGLARNAQDRGPRKKALRLAYVAAAPAVEAAMGRELTLDGEPCAWGATSNSPAPEQLQLLLRSFDVAALAVYRPDWRAFETPALDYGVMPPGEVRCCKVVLRNRGVYKMYIKIDSSAAPFLDSLTFNEMNFLAPGVPRVMEVTTRLHTVGEYVGELRIFSRTKQDPQQYITVVPVYALVAVLGKGKPAAANPIERSAYARPCFTTAAKRSAVQQEHHPVPVQPHSLANFERPAHSNSPACSRLMPGSHGMTSGASGAISGPSSTATGSGSTATGPGSLAAGSSSGRSQSARGPHTSGGLGGTWQGPGKANRGDCAAAALALSDMKEAMGLSPRFGQPHPPALLPPPPSCVTPNAEPTLS